MPTLTITIVQAELHWHDAAANRRAFSAILDTMEAPGDIVVLPEMFTTGFTMDAAAQCEPMDGPTLAWMKAAAREIDAAVCGSVIIEASGHFYNRFLFVRPDGHVEHYDKRHLFRLADEHQHYSPGRERRVFDYRGFRLCPQVCYDLRFPVWSRNRDDYDLLLYVANWPARRHLAWRTLIRARAIENQAYVVAVNRCGTDGNGLPYDGGSAIVDFLGQDIVDLGDQVATATVTLERDALIRFRERFPFHRDADRFSLEPESRL